MSKWLAVVVVSWVTACGSDSSSDSSGDSNVNSGESTSTASSSTTSTATSSPAPHGSNGPTSNHSDGQHTSDAPNDETTPDDGSASRPGASPTSDLGSSSEPATSDDPDPTSTNGAESSSEGTTTGSATLCPDGPLAEPLPNCQPEFEETGDYYADCVARINQFRWECQCLPPLERYPEAESCADQQAQYDYEVDEAHAGIGADICEPGGFAQNECPGYGGRFGIVDFCLQQMWDEGPGEDFQAHGHYINMSSQDFSRVACGTYTTPDGEIWAVQNFFP